MTMTLHNKDKQSFVPGGLLNYVDVGLSELRVYARELSEEINLDRYANAVDAMEYLFEIEAKIEKLLSKQ
jgi:hypothetical protein